MGARTRLLRWLETTLAAHALHALFALLRADAGREEVDVAVERLTRAFERWSLVRGSQPPRELAGTA